MFNYTVFDGFDFLTCGSLAEVALATRKHLKANRQAKILIFSDHSGQQMDLDLSGTDKDVVERLRIYSPISVSQRTGAGRPKLGVVSREVSLLPAQWEWLINQPGGASGAIRKLIDEKVSLAAKGRDRVKAAQEATYKFLSALAGDLPNFEEVIRYLYRRDKERFYLNMNGWGADVRAHAGKLSEGVFDGGKIGS